MILKQIGQHRRIKVKVKRVGYLIVIETIEYGTQCGYIYMTEMTTYFYYDVTTLTRGGTEVNDGCLCTRNKYSTLVACKRIYEQVQ